jgi:NAD(P)-dependent dehydrogenase (short-subunit alcohol dehydrogenase family)
MTGINHLMFEGKSLLITGGSQGIGAAAARLAALRGARVMIASPDAALLEGVSADIRAQGGTCAWTLCDVTDSAQVRAMVAKTVDTYGGLDLAFVNAGVSHPPMMPDEADDELIKHVLAVNVFGAFVTCREAIKAMLAQDRGGAVVVNGSMAGIAGVGTMAPYSTSKHAVAGLVKSFALAYGHRGIRVNFHGPGATETPMYDESVRNIMAFRKTHANLPVPSKIKGPLGRNQTAEEQAEVACFLLSDAAAAMTGAIVIADGGATAF